MTRCLYALLPAALAAIVPAVGLALCLLWRPRALLTFLGDWRATFAFRRNKELSAYIQRRNRTYVPWK